MKCNIHFMLSGDFFFKYIYKSEKKSLAPHCLSSFWFKVYDHPSKAKLYNVICSDEMITADSPNAKCGDA